MTPFEKYRHYSEMAKRVESELPKAERSLTQYLRKRYKFNVIYYSDKGVVMEVDQLYLDPVSTRIDRWTEQVSYTWEEVEQAMMLYELERSH